MDGRKFDEDVTGRDKAHSLVGSVVLPLGADVEKVLLQLIDDQFPLVGCSRWCSSSGVDIAPLLRSSLLSLVCLLGAVLPGCRIE